MRRPWIPAMQSTATTLISLLALVISVVAAASVAWGNPQGNLPSVDSHALGEISRTAARLGARVNGLEREHATLRENLRDLASSHSAGSGRVADSTVTEAWVERLVRRLLDTRSAEPPIPTAAAAESVDATAAFAQLQQLGPRAEENHGLWEQLAANDQLDAVMAAFEAQVTANPNEPQARVQLGQAYIQRMSLGGSAVPAKLAKLSIDAFDEALRLAPDHWEARYSKARSLSFWPPGYGRMGEAISEFETLMAQQETQPSSERGVETYLWLGNLHAQQGRVEEAREVWQRGLRYHPARRDLAERLARHPQ